MRGRIACILLMLMLVVSGMAAAETAGALSLAGLEWVPVVDTWQLTADGLKNGALDSTNTNTYAALDQKGDVLTYTWTIMFHETASATSGPMAGVHLLCDSATDTNRGNSLLVWQEQTMMRVYHSVNNTMATANRLDIPGLPAAPGETHSYRLVVNTKTTEITLYRDDQFVKSWIPVQPYVQGKFISFRTNRTQATLKAISFSAQ